MATPPREGSAVVVGEKGCSLSSAAVYSVSRGLSKLFIDPVALKKLCQRKNQPSKPVSNTAVVQGCILTVEESRATLAVLLNKFVISEFPVRPVIPLLIQKTLVLAAGFETIDFGSSQAFLASLCRLNEERCHEIGVTEEEIAVLENSYASSIAVCALLDCCASALVRVSDAVAALSSEAARVDVSLFDLPVSDIGLTIKDESDVAASMKAFLYGSKLAGKLDSEPFAEIPEVHGTLREAVRVLHGRTRVELNTSVKSKKVVGSGIHGKESAFAASALRLAIAIQYMSEASYGRAELVVASVVGEELRSKVGEVFQKECHCIAALKNDVDSIKRASFNYVPLLHQVYDLLVKFREILAWEAALALFAIEVDESVEKAAVVPLESSKSEKKSEKKKKTTLGKGTSIVRQLLKERLSLEADASLENVMNLVRVAHYLAGAFDPKDSELDTLIGNLKEIVESNGGRRLPKILKGSRDFGKEQMAIRERAFSVIVGVFKKHGAVALDTPAFELRETLMGKYGEDSKLIYDLADQGGELCSLRYDLTVPFARYLAMNNINALKRYQIAKVYRRDNPSKGRYREFYQCDFDIAGQYELMEPDFEVVRVLTELLNELSIGDYEIKLNHRKLLDGMLEICGIPSEKFRTVCSSIDKLDKQTFEYVKKELVEDKGLTSEIAERIGDFVKKRGPPLEILSELTSEGSQFLGNSEAVVALDELKILFTALDKSKCLNRVVFDLSLARGLDYYTGVIFEAVFKGTTQVGSIAAGGRYDNLVGMFSGKAVPAVGVSLGIERVFTIMEQLEKDRNQVIRATETQVLVAILGKGLALAAELVSELWDAKIKAEFGLTKRVMNHITRAKQTGIPWMVIVGESELQDGVVKLKSIETYKEEVFQRDKIVEELQRRLGIN
ncbi:Histidine-tRNA ligase/ATP phosphoribosyltransferase regulatory subunit protein [Dioscorea alata]|uniref:Histidine-tRNA ligase/ATP phosphoribosyltransferase regulatory subunit protein n=1 Tax=Dioscorea alata TaxID=55571 RepID=A0ACB7UL40_DIOAL|nr:Histidine-tRNA ligase/ATP phosphoribosyltransferase regulatory subunit protein [Dioscorea alata]